MRRLVNLPQPCTGTVSCAAIPDESTDVTYGDEGLAGFPGLPGSAGANGRDAFTTTASAFSMPSIGALASVQVLDNRSFTVGQRVYIANVGYFTLEALIGTTQLNLRNLGADSAAPAGALIGSGLRVTSGGQPGWDTPGNTPKRHAVIAHTEDMGDDGGPMHVQVGSGSTAQGVVAINHYEALSDPDSIVTILGSDDRRFKLPIGSWKLRIRTPAYYSRAFQIYLVERNVSDIESVCVSNCTYLDSGNGYAGIDADGADPMRHASIATVVSVTDPAKCFEIQMRQESWSFARAEALRNKALGVGSNFDNGSGVDVREIFTVIEIEEL